MQVPEDFLKGEIRNSFYVESMMKKVWAAQLEVLSDVDKVCKKYGIQYFADWGTLLGTIRHKGFIPWDDDMDITMKRPDYVKFCQVAEKEMGGEYRIYNIHTEPTWDSMLTRIVNSNTMSFEKERMKKFHGCPYVIGLDIFPLDYLSPNKEEDKMICEMIHIVEGSAPSIDSMDEREKEKTIEGIEGLCQVKLDHTKPYANQLRKLAERIGMMFSEEEAKEVALMPDHAVNRPLDVYPKEYYASSINMPFEYTTIPVPVGYENILRRKYGDNYMQPRIGAGNHEYPFYKRQKKQFNDAKRKING